jgi:hypothetical protein
MTLNAHFGELIMINDVFFPLLMLGSFFVTGVSLWSLGQWLRRKGYGAHLDMLDRECSALQNRVNRLMLPTADRFYRSMNAYTRLPLIGSKNQLVLIERVRMAIQVEQQAPSHRSRSD